MNTAQYESSTPGSRSRPAPPQNDVTLVRGREPPRMPVGVEPGGDDADVEESPLARLILTQDRRDMTRPPVTDHSASGQTTREKGLPVAVLTTDALFVTQIHAAMEGLSDVTAVGTADEAAALAVSGRCPILITDATITRSAIEPLRARLRSHDPASVLIVAGSRDQGGMFIGLQSSGAVDGFLLKPATAAATQIVVESATKRYRASGTDDSEPTRMRSRSRTKTPRTTTNQPDVIARATPTVEVHAPARATQAVAPVVSAPPAAAKHAVPRPSWPLLLVALAAVGTIVWWVTWQRMPDIDPQRVIAQRLALAQQAQQEGRWFGTRDSVAHHLQTVLALDPQNLIAQRGLDRVAVELSRKTQAAMSQRRLAEAMSSLEQLRQLQPDYAELPLLDSQLQVLRDAVLASHPPQPPVIAPKPEPVAAPAAVAARPRPVERAPAAPKPSELQAAPIAQSTAASTAISRPAATPTTATPPSQGAIVPAPLPIAPPAQSSAIAPGTAPPPAQAVSTAPPQTAGTTSEPPPMPTILKYVPPVYPAEARSRDMEGWVMMALQVRPDGTVADARVTDGERRQLFARSAMAAVRQWKYTPRPQATDTMPISVRVEFKLDKD